VKEGLGVPGGEDQIDKVSLMGMRSGGLGWC
jgi:hypothetical protein